MKNLRLILNSSAADPLDSARLHDYIERPDPESTSTTKSFCCDPDRTRRLAKGIQRNSVPPHFADEFVFWLILELGMLPFDGCAQLVHR